MKTRYTFLSYIGDVSDWGFIGVVGITYLTAITLAFYKGFFWNLMLLIDYYMLSSILIGAVIIVASSIIRLLFVTIFFPIPTPENSKFQFITIISVLFISLFTGYWGWKNSFLSIYPLGFPPKDNFIMLHSIPPAIMFVIVHYRALPHMFGTVQKRKEKQI